MEHLSLWFSVFSVPLCLSEMPLNLMPFGSVGSAGCLLFGVSPKEAASHTYGFSGMFPRKVDK